MVVNKKKWSLMVKSAWRSLVLGRMGSHYDGIFWGYRFCMPHKYQQNYWNIHACHHHSSRRVQPLQLSPRFESPHLYLQEQRSNWNESLFVCFSSAFWITPFVSSRAEVEVEWEFICFSSAFWSTPFVSSRAEVELECASTAIFSSDEAPMNGPENK